MGELVPKGTSQILSATRLVGDPISLHFDKQDPHANSDKQVFLSQTADIVEEINNRKGRSISVSVQSHGEPKNVALNGALLHDGTVLESLSLPKRNKIEISNLTCFDMSPNGKEVVLWNVTCFQLNIYLEASTVKLIDCDIGVLSVSSSENGWQVSSLSIDGCKILSLRLTQKFKLRDCAFRNCEIAAKLEKLEDKSDGRNTAYPILDRASFAFLYDWAMKSGNSETAHFARGIELAIERTTSKNIFEKMVLVAWGLFAHFGLSPLRPLLWMLTASLAMFLLLLCFGSAHTLSQNQLVGWRILLDGGEFENRMMRSMVDALKRF